jgi:beta-glucanase (GH16 family)
MSHRDWDHLADDCVQTNNMEWYDPAAITTKGGKLHITLRKKETHGLKYEGGLMSSWNKFCFTGGILEAAVTLPGTNNIVGLWAMGNLGRAGFGASLEGMVCHYSMYLGLILIGLFA